MTVQHTNLARKWRSKQFNQVVGQELSIRMLKNSLYLNQFFPVYLFSGQRGCGKTTTARIFAAALNCHKLAEFQKDPKNITVPCLGCESCLAMAQGNHPDFIEIDAASHTGVDNVRTIIDAASLLPVMGNKKLYLIDEAHMLSKAAFNAFLKILEEPPDSAIFMLATTDPQKIIDTVRSRCFKLFFTAIAPEALVPYIKTICQAEKIAVEDQALYTIVRETEGSARDALNLLEQVRFSHGRVTQQAVIKVLGHMGEDQLLGLLETILAGDTQKLVFFLTEIQFENYCAQTVWAKFQELIRTALFAKYGATKYETILDKTRFEKILRSVDSVRLGAYLEALYKQEMVLLKTTVQHGLLEMLFIQLCQYGVVQPQPVAVSSQSPILAQKKTLQPTSPVAETPQPQVISEVESDPTQWGQFLHKVATLSDPLLASIFNQAQFKSYDEATGELKLLFAQDVGFFGEWLKETEKVWMGFLKEVFGGTVVFTPLFEQGTNAPQVVQKKAPVSQIQRVPQGKVSTTPNKVVSPGASQRATIVNVTDKEKWKTASQLVEMFGGTVVEVPSDEKTQ